ncbi:MATE family efflux transporter [Larsenimonas rhizosphaerae]|uniref:MATE family efflux transporter n=1 Tax=Larsenimonas rhizosphaerae TaxID=2944682 RepID=A0AA41ZI41_9GAMM|nr:MATE family efflux transporter [Larsenimonas rhizosphaerae]MCX2525162.1 MATE family efflux transporter [Larsenimonas rhizosphaerae]
MPTRSASRLTEGSVAGSLLKLAIPIVLANILQSAYQLIDSFWIGRLGGDAVASVSISTPLIFLLFAIGSGLSVAGSTLVAQYSGAGRQRDVNRVAGQTLIMVVVVSLALSLLGHLLAPTLLDMLGVAPQVREGALSFLRYALSGVVFTFGFSMFQALMRGIGDVRMPLYIVATTVALNSVLDPLFIFGAGPIPAMGIAGAALVTLLTQCLAFTTGVILMWRGYQGIHLQWHHLKPDTLLIRQALRLGIPSSIELSARALAMNVMVVLVTGFGATVTAAYGVGMNVLGFIVIPALGLSMSTAAVVGQNIGAGQLERARHVARLSGIIAFAGLSAVGLAVFLGAPALVGFFVPSDPQVIEHGARFLRTVSLTFGFMGLQMALTGAFRAAGKTTAAMILTLISQWLLQFPLALVLSRDALLGSDGLWWTFPVTNVVIALITLVWFSRGTWLDATLTGSAEETPDTLTPPRPANVRS